MPLQPLNVELSKGQQLEALKRFRTRYGEELAKVEAEMESILTSLAEADYLAQFLGDQPEVVELRKRKAEAELLEKRRQYLGKIIDRLDQVIPPQAAVNVPPPAGAGGGRGGNVRRY